VSSLVVGSSRSGTVRRSGELLWLEAALAAGMFAALCVAVLSFPQRLGVEPDDGAYRASIVAMTQGHPLTLSAHEAGALATSLGDRPGQPPNLWVELPSGRYVSEKNPGYPFLAAPFQAVGGIRLAPLFFGGLACFGLFVGARRWLGRFGGLAAVGLYCSSGAALLFAWRDYMPTFTDASLIAAGSGVLLWVILAADARPGLRTVAGVGAFVAFELATFVRYTDVVVLGCAAATVIVAARRQTVTLPPRALAWWLASLVVFAVGVLMFDDLVYGGPLATGYAPGEVAFGLGAVGPNLRLVPAHLIQALPMLVPALVAFAWMTARWLMHRAAAGAAGAIARRDLAVGLVLAASWAATWGLYSAYFWTNDPTENTLQVVRFYVPALGAMSLLGAWLVTRIRARPWLPAVTALIGAAALFGLGLWSFHAMVASQFG
jgi:hypothetical protein